MAELRKDEGVVAPRRELQGELAGDAHPADSDASWTAEGERISRPVRKPRHRWLMWTASASLGIAMAAGGWLGSERVFEEDATQRVANHWLEFRTCLLGARLPPGTPPSQQYRFITLGIEDASQHADWPSRCAPYARALDDAMAAPSLAGQYAAAPRASALLSDGDLSARGDELNRLYDVLTAADLPVARDIPPVPAAPNALRPLFSKSQLAPLGRVETLDELGVRVDSSEGTSLRLLLPEQRPVLCSLNDGSARSQRWRSAACSASSQPIDGVRRISMARFAKGAPVLLRSQAEGSPERPGAISYYDASTGMQLWHTNETEAQAATTADGQALVLEMSPADEAGRRKHRPRLVRLAPGKRPNRRNLRLKANAHALLSPAALLWWQSETEAAIPLDEVSAQPLSATGKARTTALARLPLHAQLVADCAGAFGEALLTRNNTQPPRYTVLFHRAGSEAASVDAGVSGAAVSLACHDRFVTLLRQDNNGRVSMSRCARDGCTELGSSELLNNRSGAHTTVARGTLGEHLITAWTAPDQPVRLRVGDISTFAEVETQLVLDEPERAGLRVIGLRIISGDGLALLLLHASDGQVYALRLDGQHNMLPISVAR